MVRICQLLSAAILTLSIAIALVAVPAVAQDYQPVYWVEPATGTMLTAVVFENDSEETARWVFGTVNTMDFGDMPTVESARYITDEVIRDFPDHGADDLVAVEATHDDPRATVEITIAARHGTTVTLISQIGVNPDRGDLIEYSRAVFTDGIEALPPDGYRLLYGDGVELTAVPTPTFTPSIRPDVHRTDWATPDR